jgi:hypothetical protein
MPPGDSVACGFLPDWQKATTGRASYICRRFKSFKSFKSFRADIEQPLTERNLINLAHILPKQSQDFDLHLIETFNEVVKLTLYAHPHPMNPFKQLEYPT